MKHDLNKGQHFMVDKELLNKIVKEAKISRRDVVLEIGSGKGALTEKLLGKAKKIICVEQDTRLNSPFENVEFYNENILDIIDKLKFNVVVANIPYHISEALMLKLISIKPKKMTLVVGNTFAKKISGQSIIGCILQEIYDINIISQIDPVSFNPQPKVMSALVILELKKSFGLMHTFYQHQTRKVKNYFLKITEDKLTKKEAKKIIEKENFDFENKKLYELSTEEFFKLYYFLKKRACPK